MVRTFGSHQDVNDKIDYPTVRSYFNASFSLLENIVQDLAENNFSAKSRNGRNPSKLRENNSLLRIIT